jgi:uncharacterized membrane protein YkvA (DUF1232 family)
MEEERPQGRYEKAYSRKKFWGKMKRFAARAGKGVVEIALQLYYTLQSSHTPMWAKGVIIGALGYFISPVDAIPDVIPVAGFIDDFGVLTAAVAAVATHITPEIKKQAREKTKEWFG